MSKKILAFLLLFLCSTAVHAERSPEFEECDQKAMDDDALALCMKAETARLMKDIQQDYLRLVKYKPTKDWNKGNGLISGNLKDMYNSWIAYRNRYCSLLTVASADMYGSTNYHRESCLLEMTTDHKTLMDNVVRNSDLGRDKD